jgi:dienelactone hydrolase
VSPTESASRAALEVVRLAREGRFDVVFGRLAPPLRTLVTPEALQAAWEGEISRHGAVVSAGEPLIDSAHAGVLVVKVPIACEHGGLTVVASVAESGWLAGLQLAPAEAAQPAGPWQPPAYADPSSFAERDVTLGTGSLAVPGTLTIPAAPGPGCAVVLLGGSGPTDRDGTIGPNKPLKDLAWGLATSGMAVVRFDKVTFARGEEAGRNVYFTLADEYVPAALAAIEALRQDPALDGAQVFVAGHSLGGTAAPLVAAAHRDVAGLVILAGGAAPLHRVIVRQVRYLASLDPATAATSEPAIAALERQADLIDSADLSPSTPAANLPLGVPAPYWLYLRQYDPVALAGSLDRPILLVQGGRDYQSTVTEDLARWQAGLADQPGLTVRIYPEDNHLFIPGSGPSTPAEYDAPQHVDPVVVTDVARWLATTVGGGPIGATR